MGWRLKLSLGFKAGGPHLFKVNISALLKTGINSRNYYKAVLYLEVSEKYERLLNKGQNKTIKFNKITINSHIKKTTNRLMSSICVPMTSACVSVCASAANKMLTNLLESMQCVR